MMAAAKRVKYPNFHAVGLVSVYECGGLVPCIRVEASCYIKNKWDARGKLISAARYKLELMGVSKEKLDLLLFGEIDITGLSAVDAIGVRRVYGESVEAFINGFGQTEKKRATMIRQRRLVPYDHEDMIAIYGQKVSSVVGVAE